MRGRTTMRGGGATPALQVIVELQAVGSTSPEASIHARNRSGLTGCPVRRVGLPGRLRTHGAVVRGGGTGNRAAVVGWAAVLASQGKLNIFVVLIVAALGAEAGGLAGYGIGDRWGRKLLDRPGRMHERRQKAVATAEAVYAKWGRLAVFFTSTIISGILQNEVLPVCGLEFRRWRRVRAVCRACRLRRGQGLGQPPGRGQPERAGGRAGDRGRVRHARGTVLPSPQSPQIAGQRRRGQRQIELTRRAHSARIIGPGQVAFTPAWVMRRTCPEEKIPLRRPTAAEV